MLIKEAKRFQLLAGIIKEHVEPLNEGEHAFWHRFKVENPDTGEDEEASVYLSAYYEPSTNDSPGDQGFEILDTDSPSWVTDEMYQDEIDSLNPLDYVDEDPSSDPSDDYDEYADLDESELQQYF